MTIKGYRDLNQAETNLVNEGKELGASIGRYIDNLAMSPTCDQRAVSLAKTNLQQGLMWAVRSVAKPEGF